MREEGRRQERDRRVEREPSAACRGRGGERESPQEG